MATSQPPTQEEEDQQKQPPPAPPPPASPPLPSRHTATTPGPRATRMQELFASSLKHTLNKITWENVAACYPTIASTRPDMLKDLRKQMVERLTLLCTNDFERIMDNRSVVPKLNDLETLVSDASRRRESASPGTEPPTPPHLLPPSDVIRAHLARPLAANQSRLNAKLQNTQAENERLFAEIEAQRREIDALVSELEGVCGDVDAANELLGDVVDELAREGKEVEVEMAGTA